MWTLLDNFKNQMEEEKIVKKKADAEEQSKKFLDGIKKQMLLTEQLKTQKTANVEKDRQEIS